MPGFGNSPPVGMRRGGARSPRHCDPDRPDIPPSPSPHCLAELLETGSVGRGYIGRSQSAGISLPQPQSGYGGGEGRDPSRSIRNRTLGYFDVCRPVLPAWNGSVNIQRKIQKAFAVSGFCVVDLVGSAVIQNLLGWRGRPVPILLGRPLL